MNEKPILFSGPMVRAILEGRKTQTRRVIKDINDIRVTTDSGFQYYSTWRGKKTSEIGEEEFLKKCPYGEPGTVLWVRETWGWNGCLCCPIHYRATEPDWKDSTSNPNARWYPSIHMHRRASRINLIVKNVRVERLRDISYDDAISEGVGVIGPFEPQCNPDDIHPVELFIQLWDSINEKRGYGWDTNPWVWVVEFERVEL